MLPLTTMYAKMVNILVSCLSVFASFVIALPVAGSDAVGVVWTFPNETWIENIAVRQNGAVLCTSLSRYAVYQVDPFAHTAATVHQFDAGNGVLGISEIENDVFVVVTADVDLATSSAKPASAKMWRIDMAAWSLVSSFLLLT